MTSLRFQIALILRNDLRLLWRDLVAGKMKAFLSLGLVVLLFVIFNAVAIALFFALRQTPPLAGETVGWYFFAFVMLGAAMNHAIAVLFERADFDLLLASPVRPAAILVARLATMTVGAALSAGIFLLPVIHGAALALSFHYLSGYAVWWLVAALVSSTGVWITLLLVKWLGPRRARTWAQVIAALLGAAIYLLTQGHSFLPIETSVAVLKRVARVLSHPAIAFVARAGRGDVQSLLVLAGITGLFVTLTARLLASLFITGVQEAGGIAPSTKRNSSRRHAFVQGVARATFWKDLRLIFRDPLLLTQVLPSALYILPAVFSFGRFGGIGILAPLALVLMAQFAGVLTYVSAAGEECWDLIRMSPTHELRLRFAKMAAGMALPAVATGLICVVLAVLGRPWLALLTSIFSVGCGAACAWVQVAEIKPTPRRDIFKRGQSGGNMGRALLSGFIALVGAVGLGLAATDHIIFSAVVLGVTAVAVIACFSLIQMKDIAPRDFGGESSSATYPPGT